MSSPVRSVIVRLAMDPSSYVAGAARAERSTLALEGATARAGAASATSMERAAADATKAEGAFGKLGKATGVLGVSLGGLAGVGGLVAGALSVKWAGDYESALTRLVTTAGESEKNIGMVGQGLLDMAGKVGVSADELAKGMYTVESGGYHGAAGLTVMKAAAQGARQENADLGHVTDALTTILHDYHLGAGDAAKVTSQLIAAVSHGKITFDEMTSSLHSVTPLAAKLNIPLSDIAGTLSAMTAAGMSAEQATDNMRNALEHLMTPTAPMRAELAQLGITAQDLSDKLGRRGIAGTMQDIEAAILHHLDPATQKVLLPAFNQSKTAAQDASIMFAAMPPAVQKVATALKNGSMSFGDWRKEQKTLTVDQRNLVNQWMTLNNTASGFSQILKSGSPAAQSFTTAMQKATGTQAGLTVALMTTGENASATNAAIRDIAGAAAQADGNIEGWGKVQATFNQQLHQFEAGAKSLAIEAGQHLLPVLTSTFGYVNRDVIPGLEHVGSGAGSVLHWFSQLPAPVKDTALAFGLLKLAMKLNLLGVSSAVTGVKASFVGLREEMALQQALFAAEQRSAAATAASFGQLAVGAEAATAGLAGLSAAEEGQVARLGAMNAAASTVAIRGFGAMKAAGSGLLSMLGGPWGITLIGATLGVLALNSAIEKHDAAIKKATQDVTAWNKAISLGSGGQSAIKAANHLDDLRDKLAAVTEGINRYNAAAKGGYARGGIGSLVEQQKELRGELDKGAAAWKKQLAAMTPVEEAQTRVDIATKDLNDALKHNPPNSQAVTNASMRLHDAQQALANETGRANDAAKTQIQRMQDQANAALGLLDAQRAAQVSQLQLADAIDQYNADANDGQHTTRQLQEEQLGLVDSARQAAQSAGEAAAAQAKQNGATDTATASQAAMLKVLQDTAKTLTGPAKQAVLDMITALGGQKQQAELTAGAINRLGVTVDDLPNEHMITIDAPTAKQAKALQDLGYMTVHLPDGKVVVSADTNPAIGEIQDLLAYARRQSIMIRAGMSDLNGSASGSGRPGLAIGGILEPFADGGWYTPMSGRIADIVAPRTYRLIGDNLTSDEAFIPINGSKRSQQILSQTAGRMGYGLTSERAAPMRTRELVAAGGGGAGVAIDYRQLAAALAAAIPDRPTVSVGKWVSEAGQTPYENAEALAFISRTRS